MGLTERVDRSLKMWQKLAVVLAGIVLLSLFNLAVLWYLQKQAFKDYERAQRATEVTRKVKDFLAYHIRWKVNFLTGLLNESAPRVETDPSRCPLERFLAEYHPESPEEAALVSKILETDRRLHLSAAKVQKLFAEEADYEDIVRIYNEDINPTSKRLFALLRKLNAEFVQVREARAKEEAYSALELSKKAVFITTLILIVAAFLMLVFIAVRLSRGVGMILSVVDDLAHGDFSRPFSIPGRDEISRILQRLEQMVVSLRPLLRDVASGSENLERVSEEVRGRLEEASREAEEAGERATRMREEAHRVLESVEEEVRSINEISAAIQEISQNTTKASMVTREAVEKAQRAQEIMNRVGEASQEIEGVIQLITGIAEQTKFLALNATIEAARAGEAGKGFAVVANEVKELARQTAEATEDITQRIRAMQSGSEEAIRAADEIASIIQEIDQIASAIASAVEEQTAVIGDIAQKVEDQKAGAEEFAREAEEAYQAAQKALSGIKENMEAMRKLVALAHQLAENVSRFKV